MHIVILFDFFYYKFVKYMSDIKNKRGAYVAAGLPAI